MATNEIQSKDVPLEFSEDSGATWLVAVCRKGNNFNLDLPITEEQTDCGNIVGVGVATWGFDFDAVVNGAPTTGQASYKKFLTWANTGTKVMVRQQAGTSGADYFMSGEGYVTSLRQAYAQGATVSFSATFKGVGVLDIAP